MGHPRISVTLWTAASLVGAATLGACGSLGIPTFGAPPAGKEAQLAELRARGDAAWEQRGRLTEVRAAIEAWKRATALEPADAETWVKLSRAYYFSADDHYRFGDRAALSAVYEAGVRAADRALRVLSSEFADAMLAGAPLAQILPTLGPDAVPAVYWRAMNLARWARTQGFAVVLSYRHDVRALMTYCLDLWRDYDFGGPDRYFGALFADAATFAEEPSRAHFSESIDRFPDYLDTRVLYARHYAVRARDRRLFRHQLRYVLEADPESLPEAAPENRLAQRRARALLERAGELFE